MIETITQVPPSPEKLLCMMTDVFMEAKAEKNIKTQLKLLPMMSRISVYLHAKKHKNGHYMTSIEAVKTLSSEECMHMMQSVMAMIGMEDGEVGVPKAPFQAPPHQRQGQPPLQHL